MMNNSPNKPKRRWYQYSLRTLLLFMLVMGVGFGWLGNKVHRLRKEQIAMEKIRGLGGGVMFMGRSSSGSHSSSVKAAAEEMNFVFIGILEPSTRPGADQWLRRLFGFPETSLYHLYLGGGRVTDADLACLKHLPHLEHLVFDKTQGTDAGLEHLKGLTNLQSVTLRGTEVTEEGVKNLQQALPDCEIILKRW